MSAQECMMAFSPGLFWDVDWSKLDMDQHARFIVQRVLEYGFYKDWRVILGYYGLNRIVSTAQQFRTLDPRALAFLCALSSTSKEQYRCCTTKLSTPGPWIY